MFRIPRCRRSASDLNETVILFTDSTTLAQLPWHNLLRGIMAVLAALMISDVPYPAMPSIGFRSQRDGDSVHRQHDARAAAVAQPPAWDHGGPRGADDQRCSVSRDAVDRLQISTRR